MLRSITIYSLTDRRSDSVLREMAHDVMGIRDVKNETMFSKMGEFQRVG